MKRTIKGGALLVAPLVIASSLFSGAVSAHPGTALQIDAICTDVATEQAVYAFENKNAFDININWVNYDTQTEGSFTVAANSFYGDTDPVHNPDMVPGYATDYDPSNPNNRTAFFDEDGNKIAEQNARVSEACAPEQVPAGGNEVVDEGGNGGGDETPVVTAPEETKPVGGRGAEATPVATPTIANTSDTLADTGAEQIVPLAAAAMLAVAVLGTSVAVRKNVL